MLGIISMAGNALRSFGSIHPAIKWGVVAIVGLLAVELIAKEGISLYVQLGTAQATVEKQKAEACAAVGGPCVHRYQGMAKDADAAASVQGDNVANAAPSPGARTGVGKWAEEGLALTLALCALVGGGGAWRRYLWLGGGGIGLFALSADPLDRLATMTVFVLAIAAALYVIERFARRTVREGAAP